MIDRDAVIVEMRSKGIEVNLGAQSMLQLTSFEENKYRNPQTPVADKLFFQGLALPLSEQYTEQDVEHIVGVLTDVLDLI